jgi:hypothetical protein
VNGGEKLVLLEHVWFALALVAGTLWLVHQPVLPYLDIMSPALAVFLCAGRIGCTLVGCCHGHPSSVGIVYGDSSVADGFPAEWAGIRLFPVQAIEALSLLLVGLSGIAALPFARPGQVLVWWLVAYGVLRFGLEGLRADPRPHFLGLSQSRWMCLGEIGVAIALSGSANAGPAVWSVLGLTLPAAMVWKAIRDRRGVRSGLLGPEHILELREFAIHDVGMPPTRGPRLHSSSRGVRLAVSVDARAIPALAHVSLSLAQNEGDPRCLCRLACRVFPSLRSGVTRYTNGRVLHVAVPLPFERGTPPVAASETLAFQAYSAAVRRMQSDALAAEFHSEPFRVLLRDADEPVSRPAAEEAGTPIAAEPLVRPGKPWYFNPPESGRD